MNRWLILAFALLVPALAGAQQQSCDATCTAEAAAHVADAALEVEAVQSAADVAPRYTAAAGELDAALALLTEAQAASVSLPSWRALCSALVGYPPAWGVSLAPGVADGLASAAETLIE